VNSGCSIPIVVDIIAKVFDEFWDQVGTDRIMSAPVYFDISWTKISSV